MYVNTNCFIYPHKVLSSQQSYTYNTYIHIYRDTGDQQTDPTIGTMKIDIFRNVKVMKILTLYTLHVSSSRQCCAFREHHQQDVPSCTLTLLITDVPYFSLWTVSCTPSIEACAQSVLWIHWIMPLDRDCTSVTYAAPQDWHVQQWAARTCDGGSAQGHGGIVQNPENQ